MPITTRLGKRKLSDIPETHGENHDNDAAPEKEIPALKNKDAKCDIKKGIIVSDEESYETETETETELEDEEDENGEYSAKEYKQLVLAIHALGRSRRQLELGEDDEDDDEDEDDEEEEEGEEGELPKTKARNIDHRMKNRMEENRFSTFFYKAIDSDNAFEKLLGETESGDIANTEEIVKYLRARVPALKDIISLDIKYKHKVHLIDLYNILINYPTIDDSFYELISRIDRLTKKYVLEKKSIQHIPEQKIVEYKEKSKKMKSEITHDVALKYKIFDLNTSYENKLAIYKRYQQLKLFDRDDEVSRLQIWLDNAMSLPFDNIQNIVLENGKITQFLQGIYAKLNAELYGMNSVKEQLLMFINSKLSNPEMRGSSLGFVGPPGVGKTSIARHLAEILSWPFEQISFGGGSQSSDFLKGHDFTYVGARPGEIVRCLQRMKYKNGILFFDEYEKIADNKEVRAALLQITDFQQNHEFKDNYLADITIDLSNLWFVYSMNAPPKDEALKDRIFIINVPGYTTKEKVSIMQKYLFPKFLKGLGKNENDIEVSPEVCSYIINAIGDKSEGVRTIERVVKDVINKLNFVVNNSDENGLDSTFEKFSFGKIDTKLEFPLTLTCQIVDKLKLKSLDNSFPAEFSMYS